jgi:pyruvate/2-oxoglutarate dehydrogenase complex dihydrolipoamide acyltransferase (E2) component
VSSSPTSALVDVTMPQMGVSVAEGTVVEWRKQPGDWIEADETICDISTDKIDTEVPSPASGRVTEVLVDVGTTVDVGTVLARIATDAKPGEAHATEQVGGQGAPAIPTAPGGDGPPTSEAAAAIGATPAEATATPAPAPETAVPADAPESGSQPAPGPAVGNGQRGGRRYSPVVQRIAAEHGVDLDQVPGTGRGGRVRKQDVLAFIESGGDGAEEPPLHIESPYRPDAEPAPVPTAAPASAAAPAAEPPSTPAPQPAAAPAAVGPVMPRGKAEPLSRMRKSIGEHMKHSLETAATCCTIVEADMSRIETARRELGLTYLPFVARCVIGTLREYPSLNAWLEDDTFTQHEDINLGIAVSLGEGGLIVPVIHGAQDLSVEGIAKRIKDLARRARSRELTPDDVRGGTFTITNPGGFGSVIATPVINQPQVAILDLEAVVKRPVVVTDESGNDSIAIRPMTYLCLSWDHRALDGALAAQFLSSLKGRIESWTGA